MENTFSANTQHDQVPEEIKGWNWAAFLLNWVWGLGNRTYIALLMFVPVVNLVIIFMLGAKGNEWAWKNGQWDSVEHFKNSQRKWRNASIAFYCIFIPVISISVMSALKGEAYMQSLVAVKTHHEVMTKVGDDLKPGMFVTGDISYNGSGGFANLNYSIEGTISSAEVYVYATHLAGVCELKELHVILDDTQERIPVLTHSK